MVSYELSEVLTHPQGHETGQPVHKRGNGPEDR